MKITNVISILLLLCFHSVGFGYAADEVTVSGTVHSFDQKNVTLQSEKTKYLIPRKLVMLSEIKSGQRLSVSLTRNEFNSLETSVSK